MHIGRVILIIMFSLPSFSMDPPPKAPKAKKESLLQVAKRKSQSHFGSTIKSKSSEERKSSDSPTSSEQASEILGNYSSNKEACKAFQKAIRKNDLVSVKKFLSTPLAPILLSTPRKNTIFPLAIAIRYMNEEIILLLIDADVDVNAISLLVDKSFNMRYRSCIGYALERGCSNKVIEALLKKKAVLSEDEEYITKAYNEVKEQFEANADKLQSQELLDSDMSLND